MIYKRNNEFELYHYDSPCTLGIHIDHAGLYTGFSYDARYLMRDVVKAVVAGSGYLDGLLHFPEGI